MANDSRLDLLIQALILARKASSAIDAALSLPEADRARIEGSLDAVRGDLGRMIGQLPGASALGRRPELKTAAGVVEFVARQGAAQLGVVAGAADAIRAGGDSRTLANRIEAHLAEAGVATREELARELDLEPDSHRLQEALERALGSGRAEWYGPDVYGMPRSQLAELGEEPVVPAAEEPEPVAEESEREPVDLRSAVGALEGSLESLGGALASAEPGAGGGSEQIRELRRLADEGLISEDEFERKKREILQAL